MLFNYACRSALISELYKQAVWEKQHASEWCCNDATNNELIRIRVGW